MFSGIGLLSTKPLWKTLSFCLKLIGISIRSVCWSGEKILVGTNASEIFEVAAGNKYQPITIVQVRTIS